MNRISKVKVEGTMVFQGEEIICTKLLKNKAT